MIISWPQTLCGRFASCTGATVAVCAVVVASVIGLAQFTGESSSERALAVVTPAIAADADKTFSADQKAAIERIVRDYLVKHPEVLVEAMKELETRQATQQAAAQRQVIVDRKGSIFAASTDFALGNPKGDITVVEFFDYNCGWCKKAVDEMVKLTKADQNVRVVFKELPIFGENSQFAARAAMASIAQGKYWDYHVALMKERQVTKENALRIAERVGIDIQRLKKDMESPKIEAALKETQALAQALGIEGTPGFIVDTKVNVGFLPADGLKGLIADIRKAGCQIC
jgi:protein-disulfide isomerase